VHITYHHNRGHDVRDFDFPLFKKFHYYVFNDTSHDSLFVQHAIHATLGVFANAGMFIKLTCCVE
jgi:hypothetical protein